MATIEKLFVQIFERKISIIDQVKHQADLFDQHLASKLLIQGIAPPSWLWNSASLACTSDQKGLKKEELISQLLLPPYPASYPYNLHSVYTNAATTVDNASTLSGLFVETPKKGSDARDALLYMSENNVNSVRCSSSGLHEQDACNVTPPQIEFGAGISDKISVPPQSLAKIQRSKSRQRALELRNSAKAVQSCLYDDNYISKTPGSKNACPENKCFNEIEMQSKEHVANETICERTSSKAISIENVQEPADSIASCQRTLPSESATRIELHEGNKIQHPNVEDFVDDYSPKLVINEQNKEDAANKSISEKRGSEAISIGRVQEAVNSNFSFQRAVPPKSASLIESYGSNKKHPSDANFLDEYLSKLVVDEKSNGYAANENICERRASEVISIEKVQKVAGSSVSCQRILLSRSAPASGSCQVNGKQHPSDETFLDGYSPKLVVNEQSDGVVAIKNICEMRGSDAISIKNVQEAADSSISCHQARSSRSAASVKSCEGNRKLHPSDENFKEEYSRKLVTNEVECSSGLIEKNLEYPFTSKEHQLAGCCEGLFLKKSVVESPHSTIIDKMEPTVVDRQHLEDNCHHESATNMASNEEILPERNFHAGDDDIFLDGPVGSFMPTHSSLPSSEQRLKDSNMPFQYKHNQFDSFSTSNLTIEAARLSSGDLIEEAGLVHPTNIFHDWEVEYNNKNIQNLPSLGNVHVDKENTKQSFCIGRTMQERKSLSGEAGLYSCCDFGSPHKRYSSDLIGGDHAIPVFEGFNADEENEENMIFIQRDVQEKNSQLEEVDPYSHCTLGSPHKRYSDLIGNAEAIPVLESFIMETDEKQPRATGGDFNVHESDFANSTIERATVIEKLCKSANTLTPLSHLSDSHKLHKVPNAFHSVPVGLLEHMDLKNMLSLDDDAGGRKDELSHDIEVRSYSDGPPFSFARFGWDIRRPNLSPIGKLWERSISNFGCVDKRRTINPELTCFPIEEDPSTGEETGNGDEIDGLDQDGFGLLAVESSVRREPPADIFENNQNLRASVSTSKNIYDRGSLESVGTNVTLPGNHNKFRRKQKNNYSNKRRRTNETNDKKSSSVGRNGLMQSNGSLKNYYSKPKVSKKSSLKKEGLSSSQRGSRHNNIVSNISSFIPLVQQKQAATITTGKRDIKIKALEAAEAAKRLEEKREHERKMKKEAMKLGRARLEQENLRQLELKKKNKEEKKKKDDVVARKRIREEEIKEREGKRKHIEEAHRQQKERENINAQIQEKETLSQSLDEICHERLKTVDEMSKNNVEKDKGDINRKSEMAPITPMASHSDTSKACILLKDCCTFGIEKVTKNGEDIKTTREKSYEISPYQGTDDENEDEDEVPDGKFFPSWASKNSLELDVFGQQAVDTDEIFPPESFCSIAEVLLPRKK